jgi:UDP-glucose 4-epimerase
VEFLMAEAARRVVFITGAAGFVGRNVARILVDSNWAVRGGVRVAAALPDGVKPVVTGDLADAVLDFSGVDAVVHVAGKAHRRGVSAEIWERENCAAAVNVAAQAKAAGVARFVLVSTILVLGRMAAGMVDESTPAAPEAGYARAKWQAEQRLREIYGDGLTVVRPMAVVGPHCPGNLQLVMKFLRQGVPLPFGSIRNRRSFIEVTDLARLMRAVLEAQKPPPLVLAAHPEPIGTAELVRALARGMGVSARMLPCPAGILAAGARLAGRAAMVESLAGDFVVDPKAALALGWRPAESLAESLLKTGAAFVVS